MKHSSLLLYYDSSEQKTNDLIKVLFIRIYEIVSLNGIVETEEI